MKKNSKYLKIFLTVIVLGFIGVFSYGKAQAMFGEVKIKSELLANVRGVKVDGRANYFSSKPFSSLTISIPSLASIKDDEKSADKANQVINRELLDQGIQRWLEDAIDRNELGKLTNHVTIYYRDIPVIDEELNKS